MKYRAEASPRGLWPSEATTASRYLVFLIPFALRGVGGIFGEGAPGNVFAQFFEFVGWPTEEELLSVDDYARGEIDLGKTETHSFAGGYSFTDNSTDDSFHDMSKDLKRGTILFLTVKPAVKLPGQPGWQ